jgi:[acyl-carrier-protein] S-malonyltransferase
VNTDAATGPTRTPGVAALLSPQIRIRAGEYRDLYDADPTVRDRLAIASTVLGVDLAGPLLHGAEDEVNRGAVARPVIVALSVAAYRRTVTEPPDYLAGLSLGQVTAAHLAGCLSFADAVRAAHTMATIEAEEFDGTPLGVYFYSQVDPARLLAAGADLDSPERPVRPCAVLADDQVIMTGELTALAELARQAFTWGGAGVVIPYGPPAHCDLLAGVRRRFAAEWTPIDEVCDPAVPLICNLTARPLRTRGEVLDALVAQYTTPVRWADSLRTLADLGVRRVVVPGPGAFIARSLRTTAVPLDVITADQAPAGTRS